MPLRYILNGLSRVLGSRGSHREENSKGSYREWRTTAGSAAHTRICRRDANDWTAWQSRRRRLARACYPEAVFRIRRPTINRRPRDVWKGTIEMKPLFPNTLFLARSVRWLNNEMQNLIDRPFGTPKVPGCRLLHTCNTHSKIVLYRLTVSFGMEPNNSSKVFASGRPQYFLKLYRIMK